MTASSIQTVRQTMVGRFQRVALLLVFPLACPGCQQEADPVDPPATEEIVIPLDRSVLREPLVNLVLPGNQLYRRIIKDIGVAYYVAVDAGKNAIIDSVVLTVKSQTPPGRFLVLSKSGQKTVWVEAPELPGISF